MNFNIFILLILAFISTNIYAKNLCTKEESTIFAFETKSKKILSVCKDSNDRYMAYRFGTAKQIELQFPNVLDKNSWGKFEFLGRNRSGGKINAGYGEYSLSFQNGYTDYTVFQEWDYEDDSYTIGVTITNKGKSITINGLRQTQEGSLVLLEKEGKNIHNLNE